MKRVIEQFMGIQTKFIWRCQLAPPGRKTTLKTADPPNDLEVGFNLKLVRM